jgi:hypothetical protein
LAQIEVTASVNTGVSPAAYSYRLTNTGPGPIAQFTLTVGGPVADATAPTGWISRSAVVFGQTRVLFISTAPEHDLLPGASAEGLGFTSDSFPGSVRYEAFSIVSGGGPAVGVTTGPCLSRRIAALEVTACGDRVQIRGAVGWMGPVTLRWRKDGQVVNDGARPSGAVVLGSGGDTLSIRFATAAESGRYTLEAVSACGSVMSQQTEAIVCRGDWDCSGAVDFNDLLAFLNDYIAGARDADLNRDGAVDFNDLLEFFNRFSEGC